MLNEIPVKHIENWSIIWFLIQSVMKKLCSFKLNKIINFCYF